ncbi:hypothetical protein H072_5907 [Dactylellina haptotyla CBS 200.50]|uniref:Uncharacterized protein n=1 Tax=Dactylellina haptotyla (strain CBS 200.50) TaxID=1284197 RepID=S8BY75_DACHA|nr:hypothetical protein H072_5907 [Dactylellina haptotyla CBS 200.50]
MDLYLFFDWVQYLIVRLFVFFGVLTILPILLLLLLEPLVILFRFVEDCLPSSIARKKPTRKASMSFVNLSAISSDVNPGQDASGLRNRKGEESEAVPSN